jgi:hypothetical protein
LAGQRASKDQLPATEYFPLEQRAQLDAPAQEASQGIIFYAKNASQSSNSRLNDSILHFEGPTLKQIMTCKAQGIHIAQSIHMVHLSVNRDTC